MSENRKYKIMLIDDSSTNNILYESILLDEGYDVVVCEDGKSALKILSKDLPDLIMLDLMMPGMDGLHFLEKMKEVNTKKELPIIMLTAHAEHESQEKAFQLGVREYIVKPAGILEITEKVKKLLSNSAK
jgi:DNA-binding response OmpR family regulator